MGTSLLKSSTQDSDTYCLLAGNEGVRALDIPFEGLQRVPGSPIPC